MEREEEERLEKGEREMKTGKKDIQRDEGEREPIYSQQ